MTALGVLILPISVYFHLPNSFSFSGNLICELFMTIFNIHFFSQIQKKVDKEYMGRVFSTIFTLSIILAPVSTLLMSTLPTINFVSYIFIGIGVLIFSLLSYFFQNFVLNNWCYVKIQKINILIRRWSVFFYTNHLRIFVLNDISLLQSYTH